MHLALELLQKPTFGDVGIFMISKAVFDDFRDLSGGR